MGVGSRNLGASAETRGGVGSRPLESPGLGCCLGWRVLAIRNQAAWQVTPQHRLAGFYSVNPMGFGWGAIVARCRLPIY